MTVARPRVALTFDTEHADRPATPGNEAALLDALAAADAKATFFVQGRWALANPDLARRIVDDGHVLGSHAHHHVPLPSLTREGLRREIDDAAAALAEASGRDGRPWFRNPFGAGADDPAVRGSLTGAGYRHVGWHVDPEDWDPAHGPEDVVHAVVAGSLSAGDGAVILLHGWPDATRVALPALVGRLRDSGAEVVTIEALDEVPDLPPWATGATPG